MKKCRMMNVLQNMRHHRLPHQLMKDRFDSAAAIQSLIRIRASQCYDSRQTVSAQVSPPPAFVKLPHSTTVRNTLYWNVISLVTSQAQFRSWQNLLLDISLIFRFKCCSIN